VPLEHVSCLTYLCANSAANDFSRRPASDPIQRIILPNPKSSRKQYDESKEVIHVKAYLD